MKQIYEIPLPETAQPEDSDRESSEIADSGLIQSDGSLVEQLSSDPSEVSLEGILRYGRPFSRIAAKELEELASSSFSELALFRRDADRALDGRGWYELDSAEIEPLHPNREEIYRYRLTLKKVGTSKSKLRALETSNNQVDHDEQWGNDQDRFVTLPESASKVEWFDADSEERAGAESVATRETEFGTVDIYDVDDGAAGLETDTPKLIHQIDKIDDGATDLRVFDTRENSAKLDEDGRRQWRFVFSSEHEFDGAAVIDTGAVRLILDEADGTLDAGEWDNVAETWVDVGLTQPSEWSLLDIDIGTIGMVRADVQLTLEEESGDRFALNATLQRGGDDVLFSIPSDETGPIPSAILDWLEPIAASAVVDSAPAKTLVTRSRTRK